MPNSESIESRVPSSRYSDKLKSLLNFLDEHCDQNNDSDAEHSSNHGGRGTGASPSRRTRTGLGDVTNQSSPAQSSSEREEALTCQDEEKLKDIDDRSHVSSNARRLRAKSLGSQKKYIWDDWSETADGVMVSLQDEPTMDGDDLNDGLRANDRQHRAGVAQQLQELKSMSREIQARADAMKVELEKKNNAVEELHSIRVENESKYVQRMKSVKSDWKKRLDSVKAERDGVLKKQEKLKEKSQRDCETLENTISNLQAAIERTVKSERETCERLRRDGVRVLEEARKSWTNAEREELKRRDQKMSPKLKRDAAKAIEPKLKQLVEKHKEEIERLEREAAMELDSYKLELYKRSNSEFKNEMNTIRVEERKDVETLEMEWIAKLESSRIEHDAEIQKVREEYEQRVVMRKRQFDADKQRCIDDHEARLKDTRKADEFDLQQIRARHDCEMKAMEEEYSEKTSQRQKLCEEEVAEWKTRRESELARKEKLKLDEEYAKVETKIQSDIDLVKRKLREERDEKRQQMQMDQAERSVAIKEANDAETQRLEGCFEQAMKETIALSQKEEDESHDADELQNQLDRSRELLAEKEDEANIQMQRLAELDKERNYQELQAQHDGNRKVVQATNEKCSLEKMLDKLIASHPKKQDEWEKELEDIKADNEAEITLAETKVRTMLENKRLHLTRASAKLNCLQEEAAKRSKQLDDARNILHRLGS